MSSDFFRWITVTIFLIDVAGGVSCLLLAYDSCQTEMAKGYHMLPLRHLFPLLLMLCHSTVQHRGKHCPFSCACVSSQTPQLVNVIMIDKEERGSPKSNLLFWSPSPRQLCEQDSNVQSPIDMVSAYLLHHLWALLVNCYRLLVMISIHLLSVPVEDEVTILAPCHSSNQLMMVAWLINVWN